MDTALSISTYIAGLSTGLVIGYLAGYIYGIAENISDNIKEVMYKSESIERKVDILVKKIIFPNEIPPANIIDYSSDEEDSDSDEESDEEDSDSESIYLGEPEEFEILSKFADIEGSLLSEIELYIKQRGYSMRIIYVDEERVSTNTEYNPKVIGIRISDHYYNYETHQPSDEAVIIDLIDVGGVDRFSRG